MLTQRQKEFIEQINDQIFTVENVERYYKNPNAVYQSPEDKVMYHLVKGFMKAVNGLLTHVVVSSSSGTALAVEPAPKKLTYAYLKEVFDL